MVEHPARAAGKRPPMVEVLNADEGVRFVYRAEHNEEGGRFWRKSNENIVAFLDDERVIETNLKMFCWASLSQIKELALMDNSGEPIREDDSGAAIGCSLP